MLVLEKIGHEAAQSVEWSALRFVCILATSSWISCLAHSSILVLLAIISLSTPLGYLYKYSDMHPAA